MSKKNRNINRNKHTNDRYDWIGDGIPELQEQIELHLMPKKEDTITIPRSEYDELIKSQISLSLIEGLRDNVPSYELDSVLNAILGKREENKHEPKSE